MKKMVYVSGALTLALIALPTLAQAPKVFTQQLIQNGAFDDGLSNWVLTSVDEDNNIDNQLPLDGNYVTLGNLGETEMVSQVIAVPKKAGNVTLDFYYRFYTNDNTQEDYATFGVFGETAADDYALIRYAVDGDQSDWTYSSLDLSKYAGDTIQVFFAVVNNAASLTFADFDSMAVTVQSNGVLKGTVVRSDDGSTLHQAKVKITNANDKLLWKGKINKKGKFVVSLPGSDKKYNVKISKDEDSVTDTAAITWAEVTKKTFEF